MKLDIVLAIPGLPFNGDTFPKQSLGGSETAGYYIARGLAKLGHRVTVFCNTEKPVHCADVDYLPLAMFRQYSEYTLHDVCVVQRTGDLFASQNRARFSALWCHDLALLRQENRTRGTAWNYDKLFVLSDFMRKQYQEVYGLPDDLLFQTRNGVDLDLVAEVRASVEGKVSRNPLSLVYSARPERGLDILLREIMPRVLKHEPNARLFLSAYENKVPDLAAFYADCDAMAKALGNSVVNLGALTKRQLYEVYHSAAVYVYPTPSTLAPDFDEVSCISLMEAQACGLPVVSSARGALPETLVPEAGILVSEDPFTPAYYDAFAEAVLRFTRDPVVTQAAHAAGLKRAENLGWDAVAAEWSEMFTREIAARNNNLATLANHFWRHSDIYAAREVLKQLPTDDAKSAYVRERVAHDWAFLDRPDGFREQYEGIGSTHDAAVVAWSPQEPRYAALRDWLAMRKNEVKSVLDYGCAHGGYATNLLKELPELRITGIDIDLHGIEMAYGFAKDLGVSDRWRGVVGDFSRLTDSNVPEMTEMYDAAVAQEVLEHVADPAAVLAALEQRVRDGGYVYVTVPFGPWEFSDYQNYPYRAHIWEFDFHDLQNLLALKGSDANVSTCVMPFGYSAETAEPLGWWVVQYQVTAENRGKVGVIDMVRKLALQRPRQTLSAAIIAGPNCEETLHWCLRSIEHQADEVIIVDCGLSDEAKRIISTYSWQDFDPTRSLAEQRGRRHFLNIKVVPGVDPKVEGFETPRNIALEHCTQDWVLWIDTDEKLLQPERLTKYLRSNIFQGYSIKQHHFAVDHAFDADMPVRMLRNNGRLRFFGMIHEHPETELNKGPGRTIVISDAHIAHVGYLIESGRQQRFRRNLPMLQADMAKYPERLLQKHFIMRDTILLCSYDLQRNGGVVTPEIKARAEEVVRLYRKYFMGKGHFTNSDPLIYYSQACTLLGIGFDATFQVSADKYDAQPGALLKGRFATVDDFMAETARRAKDSVQHFENRYW